MLDTFDIFSPSITIRCEGAVTDAAIRTESAENTLTVYLSAREDKPCFVDFCWKAPVDADLLALSDAWERSYGELGFLPVRSNDRAMPWYFMLTDKENSFCFGVKTQPAAFVSFRVTETGVTAVADCRNGGQGVALQGRELHLCTFIYKRYCNGDPFAALCDFCRELCPAPILPTFPVYGGNDWYNAYGHNSFNSVISAAEIHRQCTSGIANAPFMVIDDGWELGHTCGPWLPNEKFGDMRKTCNEIKARGLRPGIWIRPLQTEDPTVTEDMLIYRNGKREFLDPTHPATQALLKADIARIRDWGYELIKYDYSTYDLLGNWGKDLADTSTKIEKWHFFNKNFIW